jgi:flagellar assembly factor FliW
MYKIILPLLGFESIQEIDITSIDDKFSTLVLSDDKSLNINIVNITYFKDVSFDFNIDDETLEKLHIHELTDFKIFFCVVMQKPIEDSIVNLAAPILINERQKLIGQYVIQDRIPKLFTTLNTSSI